MDKFLQILEDGRLTDGKGQTAYFSHSVIIFTSNIGSSTLKMRDGNGQLETYEQIRQHYRQAVAHHFANELKRPELLNRLGENVLVFDLLRPQFVSGIFRKFAQSLGRSAREQLDIELAFSDDSVERSANRRDACAGTTWHSVVAASKRCWKSISNAL